MQTRYAAIETLRGLTGAEQKQSTVSTSSSSPTLPCRVPESKEFTEKLLVEYYLSRY